MITLLKNMKSLLETDSTLSSKVKHFGIGETELEQYVALNRFPFVIVDRASDTGEEYVVTYAKDLKKRLFHITVKIAVRNRKRKSALLDSDGLLSLYNDVMTAIFSDETVGGRVEKLYEEITVEEADIAPQGTYIGMGRQINLTYMTEE